MDLQETTKVKAVESEQTTKAVELAFLLALAMILPFIRVQMVTGPLVNAVLFIAVAVLGLRSAILICAIPSVVSLGAGLLPFVLAPMAPFIILGNMILAAVFNYFWKRNYWLGAVAASCLKFIFLFVSSQLLFGIFIKRSLRPSTKMS